MDFRVAEPDLRGLYSVTKGSDSATKGSDSATKVSDSATKVSESATKVSESSTKVSESATKVSDSATKVSESATKVSDSATKVSDSKINKPETQKKISKYEESVVQYLSMHGKLVTAEVEDLLKVKEARARRIIMIMVKKQLIIKQGAGKRTYYILPDKI